MPKSSLKILIRLDADHNVGLAHAIRVAKILSLVKSDIDLHLIGVFPHYNQFFNPATKVTGFPAEMLSEKQKAQFVVETAVRINADIILVDHPHLGKISWDIFMASDLPIIAIDDEGGPVKADQIFNGTILKDYHHYPHMTNSAGIHCGSEYTLINPCFAANPWSEPKDLSLISVIGSGDRACDWAMKLTANHGPLSKLNLPHKTIVVGAAFPQIEQLAKNCHASNICLHQGLDQPAMAKMLSQHSVGLITGGMIVYESLAVGLPVIVFPQEKNLPPEARFFSGQGCIIDLKYEGGMDMNIVSKNIINIMNSRIKRLTLSRNARQLIDGKGMLRTIKAMDIFFRSLKEKETKKEHIL